MPLDLPEGTGSNKGIVCPRSDESKFPKQSTISGMAVDNDDAQQ